MASKKRKAGKNPTPPKEYYDRPYLKRQPRDKDDVLVTRNRRGQRTVYRGGQTYSKLPPEKRRTRSRIMEA